MNIVGYKGILAGEIQMNQKGEGEKQTLIRVDFLDKTSRWISSFAAEWMIYKDL